MTWLFASCLVFVFVYLSFIPPVSLSTKRSAQDINHSSPILKLFQFMDGGNFPTGHWVGRSLCQTLAALKDASLQLGYPPKTTFVSILRPLISDARIARTGYSSLPVQRDSPQYIYSCGCNENDQLFSWL